MADCRMAGALRRRRRQCLLGGRDQRCALEVAPDATHRRKARNTPRLPGSALRAASYSGWAKTLQAHLYETARATCRGLRDLQGWRRSRASPKAIFARAWRWRRARSATPRWPSCASKWQAKLLQLSDQIRRAEDRHEREKSQLSQQKMQTAVTIGSSILGALLGRKAISATNVGRVGTAARSATRIGRESRGRRRAPRKASKCCSQRLADTQREVEAEVARLETTLDAFHAWRCAGRSAGAQIRYRRRRSRAGVGAVAQGRRRFPGARLRVTRGRAMKELIDMLTERARRESATRPKAARRCCSRPPRTSSAQRNSPSCWERSRPVRSHEEGAGRRRWRPRRVVRRHRRRHGWQCRADQRRLSAASASSASTTDDAKKFVPVMLDFLRTKVGPDVVSKLEKTLRA